MKVSTVSSDFSIDLTAVQPLRGNVVIMRPSEQAKPALETLGISPAQTVLQASNSQSFAQARQLPAPASGRMAAIATYLAMQQAAFATTGLAEHATSDVLSRGVRKPRNSEASGTTAIAVMAPTTAEHSLQNFDLKR